MQYRFSFVLWYLVWWFCCAVEATKLYGPDFSLPFALAA